MACRVCKIRYHGHGTICGNCSAKRSGPSSQHTAAPVRRSSLGGGSAGHTARRNSLTSAQSQRSGRSVGSKHGRGSITSAQSAPGQTANLPLGRRPKAGGPRNVGIGSSLEDFQRSGLLQGYSEEMKKEALGIFRWVDGNIGNNDGIITLREWNKSFDFLDSDKNGVISRKEWMLKNGTTEMFDKISKAFSVRMTRAEWGFAFQELDKNGNGEVDMSEWLGPEFQKGTAGGNRQPAYDQESRYATQNWQPGPAHGRIMEAQDAGGIMELMQQAQQNGYIMKDAGGSPMQRGGHNGQAYAVSDDEDAGGTPMQRGGHNGQAYAVSDDEDEDDEGYDWLLRKALKKKAAGEETQAREHMKAACQQWERQAKQDERMVYPFKEMCEWLLDRAMTEEGKGKHEISEWLFDAAVQQQSGQGQSTSEWLMSEALKARESEENPALCEWLLNKAMHQEQGPESSGRVEDRGLHKLPTHLTGGFATDSSEWLLRKAMEEDSQGDKEHGSEWYFKAACKQKLEERPSILLSNWVLEVALHEEGNNNLKEGDWLLRKAVHQYLFEQGQNAPSEEAGSEWLLQKALLKQQHKQHGQDFLLKMAMLIKAEEAQRAPPKAEEAQRAPPKTEESRARPAMKVQEAPPKAEKRGSRSAGPRTSVSFSQDAQPKAAQKTGDDITRRAEEEQQRGEEAQQKAGAGDKRPEAPKQAAAFQVGDVVTIDGDRAKVIAVDMENEAPYQVEIEGDEFEAIFYMEADLVKVDVQASSKADAQAEEKARKSAAEAEEARAKAEAEEKARKEEEAQARAKAEEEEKARKEAEEAEVRAKAEAEEKARKEAEEADARAKAEAEEKARKEAAAAGPKEGEYLLEQLQDKEFCQSKGLDAKTKELCLPDAAFEELFGMPKADWPKVPNFQKERAKKKHKLF